MPKLGKTVKVVFIYNPASGKGRTEKNIDFIKSEITKKFGSVDVIRTESPEHLKESVAKASRTYDYVLFSGGDGTFSMVISSIPDDIPNERLPIFGYLPGGSTNDSAYNLNISKRSVKEGLKDLLYGATPQLYDIGEIGECRFVQAACHGAFTNIGFMTPPIQKKKWGILAYVWYGIKAAFNIKTFHFTIDGEIIDTPLVICSMTKQIATFVVNPEKPHGDKQFWCAVVNRPKKGKGKGVMNVAYFFAFGAERAVKKGRISLFTGTKFTVDCDSKEPWGLDGEQRDMKFPSSCGYCGRTIKILTNR